ncbi:MAG: ABC transporter ATP-binding protein [Rhizobiaceae bacterium]
MLAELKEMNRMPTDVLLNVEHLEVTFGAVSDPRAVRGVQDVSFHVRPGETLGIVGESGCGKTMSALAVIGLLPEFAVMTGGSIAWKGKILSARDARRLRGRSIAMIPQDAMTALNPLLTVESQIGEVLRMHRGMRGAQVRSRILELLELVRIDEPRRVAAQRPWQLSGGMAQRVVIAMALAAQPELLIADEPTTALDVTVQSEILALLHSLQTEFHLALVMITHDLGIVAHMTHRTAVMYAGRIVETGLTRDIFRTPSHPYTRGLIASTPHPFVRQEMVGIRGQAPLALVKDHGCSYRERCDYAMQDCEVRPELLGRVPDGHKVACWRADLAPVRRV